MANFDFDWLYIDIEHNLFNQEALIDLISTIRVMIKRLSLELITMSR